MMTAEAGRQVALDLETTGLTLGATAGNRIIEIGCVEIIDRKLTGREYQQYVDPERDIEPGALDVHGITRERLRGQPKFAEVYRDVLAFVEGAEVLIHNAEFDVGFLNYELGLVRHEVPFDGCCAKITDTLLLARTRFPGGSGLDHLCDHFNVDRSHRSLHGALLDAQLLARVYLHMTGGQIGLDLAGQSRPGFQDLKRPDRIRVLRPTGPEQEAHAAFLDELDRDLGQGQQCLWRKVGAP